jgi:hypothetical protein
VCVRYMKDCVGYRLLFRGAVTDSIICDRRLMGTCEIISVLNVKKYCVLVGLFWGQQEEQGAG